VDKPEIGLLKKSSDGVLVFFRLKSEANPVAFLASALNS